ncbi:MAG: Hsp70 family protein [Bacteroidia bacterium]|nr:Hsp70 family protein [Bacteroidia bacterium]MDW8159039.1 Hsp70 family protein [Bacteroidia bacterium]
MIRTRIDFGIDLGTTNSAIASFSDGELKLYKTDTGKETLPSCVYFNKKGQIFVGDKALNGYKEESAHVLKNYKVYSAKKENKKEGNSYIEFKRTMGTDETYFCPNLNRSFTSEELSAQVLKTLKSFVKEEELLAAVITVPAKFRQVQIDATLRAAKLAGFEHCELLQEQIAASLAYGINPTNLKGYWLVFDLGGGTFDVALMTVEKGEMKVVDTDGDNHLGGKDIDLKIVDEIFIPYLLKNYTLNIKLKDLLFARLLRERLKVFAEEAKIQLSTHSRVHVVTDEPLCGDDVNEEMELDLTIEASDIERVATPIFMRTINIAKRLLQRNSIEPSALSEVILVGGPTYSPLLRSLLQEHLTPHIDTSVDPMTAVARGAAIYASNCPLPEHLQYRDTTKLQLELVYPSTIQEALTSIEIKPMNALLDSEVQIEIAKKNKTWSSGRITLSENLKLDIPLEEGQTNVFTIEAWDAQGNRIFVQPDTFTVVHGLKLAQPTLPYDYGIASVKVIEGGKRKEVLTAFEGTRKNVPLPARGRATFKTQTDLEPGNADEKIKIVIYEGENNTRPLYNEFAGELEISGLDVEEYVPAGSEMEVTLYINESRKARLTVFLPSIDATIEKEIEITTKATNPTELANFISFAENTFNSFAPFLEEQEKEQLAAELREIKQLFEKGKVTRDTNEQVKERLRELMKALDAKESVFEVPRHIAMLNEALQRAQELNIKRGDKETAEILKELESLAAQAIESKDSHYIEEVYGQVRKFVFEYFDYYDPYFWVGLLYQFSEDYNKIQWKNPARAKQLITSTVELVRNKPDALEEIRKGVSDIAALIIDPFYTRRVAARSDIPVM